MTQLIIDFEAAAFRRDAGIARSSEHASDRWTELAVGIVAAYARQHAAFLTEDVRAYAKSLGLADPPDGRAWGGVMKRARARRIIVACGYAPSKSSNLSPKVLWSAA